MIPALFLLPGLLTVLGVALVRGGTMYPRSYFFLIGFAVLILVRGVTVMAHWIAAASPRLAPALTAVLATALVAGSAPSLIRNYRYPKQDFEGAMRFIDDETRKGETVVTVGAATHVYREYYLKPWERADTAQQLDEICRRGRSVWLVYTFPRYLAVGTPALMESIRRNFTVIRVFPGTLGDGDIFVASTARTSPDKSARLGHR